MNHHKSPDVGYSLDGLPYTFSLAFLRADIETVCQVLAPYFDPPDGKPPQGLETVIFKFDHTHWTGFFYDDRCIASLEDLSNSLQADCVVLEHESCSSWTRFRQIRNGEVVEEYEFGWLEEERRDDIVSGWDVVTRDEFWNEFRFRSSVRTLDPSDLKPEDKFLDAAFRRHDIWCPDWDTISKLPAVPGVKAVTRRLHW